MRSACSPKGNIKRNARASTAKPAPPMTVLMRNPALFLGARPVDRKPSLVPSSPETVVIESKKNTDDGITENTSRTPEASPDICMG